MRYSKTYFDSDGYESIGAFCADVNEHYNEIIDGIETRINEVMDKLDIKDIDDIYKIAEAYSELRDISTELY